MTATESSSRFDYIRLARILLAVIGAVGVGIGVWLWASTGPDLAIGEDIPAALVLGGVAVFLAALGLIGPILFTRARKQDSSPGSGEFNDSNRATTKAQDTDLTGSSKTTDSGNEAVRNGREEQPPDPPEGVNTEDGDWSRETVLTEVDDAAIEAGIALEDTNAGDASGGDNPNRNRPVDQEQSTGHTETTDEKLNFGESTAEQGNRNDSDIHKISPADRETSIHEGNEDENRIVAAPRSRVPEWLKELTK